MDYVNENRRKFVRLGRISRLTIISYDTDAFFRSSGPKLKQLEGDECPLHVKHPPTGEEYALGCGVCRNAHTF